MKISDYVKIVITVPETHADEVRQAMGKAGAGTMGNYSFCSYSAKVIGRFLPNKGASPYLGKEDVLETVNEERIETFCKATLLNHVLLEIRKVHPYEEPGIDVYPLYEVDIPKHDVSG